MAILSYFCVIQAWVQSQDPILIKADKAKHLSSWTLLAHINSDRSFCQCRSCAFFSLFILHRGGFWRWSEWWRLSIQKVTDDKTVLDVFHFPPTANNFSKPATNIVVFETNIAHESFNETLDVWNKGEGILQTWKWSRLNLWVDRYCQASLYFWNSFHFHNLVFSLFSFTFYNFPKMFTAVLVCSTPPNPLVSV